MLSKFTTLYNRLVLRQPVATLIALTVVITYFLLYIPQFELDASADSLVLENDSFNTTEKLCGIYNADDGTTIAEDCMENFRAYDSAIVLET